MGGSSTGSSATSSLSKGGSTTDMQLRPGPDEGDHVFGADAALTKGIFGVLYTVCKEKVVSAKFAAFRLFMDWLQLFLLTVNPSYGFNINSKSISWQILYFIQLNDFMKARGYAFFLVCLYIMVAGLFTAVLVSVWVGWSFHNNRFDHVWPIVFLKWFANVFFQTLDIASVTLFLIVLDCQYFDRPAEQIYHNQEFPRIMCWSMPHLIHVVVATLSLVVFVAMAMAFSMAEMDLNLLTPNVLAQAHTRVELITFAVKVIMTFSNVFVNSNKWLTGVNIVGSYIMLWVTFQWVPHYIGVVNCVRVGTYTSTLWTSIMMAVVVWVPGSQSHEHAQHLREIFTIVTYVGVPFAVALGAGATWLRLRWFTQKVLPRFREIDVGTHPADVYEFSDPREVEILARCCRQWVTRDQLDPSAVALATAVMKNGMSQLQKHPFMIILYSSFLIEVQTSYQSGYKMLQSAKKCDPSLLERFAIFAREQQHTQKGAGTPGEATDLVSYVEFQRNYSMAMRVHKDALLSMRAFWGMLLHSSISFTSLTKAVKTMDVNIRHAESVYRMVLQRHANNARMVRMYAKFMEHVKNDPWASSKWFMEADRLKEIEETQRTNNMVFVGGDADPALQEALTSDTEERGIIVANAMGEIQMANSTIHTMLGYAKQELRNKNISSLMPGAISTKHSTYVHNYVTTGRERFMHRWNDVVVVNKDKTMMPVRLQVAKLSGIGEDTVFIGLFEAVKRDEDAASIWVGPSSQVVAVDPNFTDWLGHQASDIVGSSLWHIVVDRTKFDKILHRARVGAQEAKSPSHFVRRKDDAGERVSSTGYTGARGQSLDHGNNFADKLPQLQLNTVGSANTPPLLSQRSSRRASFVAIVKKGMGLDGPNDAANPVSLKTLLSSVWSPDSVPLDGGYDGYARSGSYAYDNASSWELPSLQLKHKYDTDRPKELSVVVTNGGMGALTFQKLTLRRRSIPPRLQHQPSLPTDNLMLVLCKGRTVHITNALAAWLGTTSKAVIAASAVAQNPMDALIPEPFATLHAGPGMGASTQSSSEATLFSCRSGKLSMPLTTIGPHGQDVLPFKISMIHTVQPDNNTCHVVHMQPSSLQEALAERRVTLILDQIGTVKRVAGHAAVASNSTIFGFDPALLVGRNVAEFVDVFRADAATATGKEDDPEELQHNVLLAALVAHVSKHDGASWCVGVLPPVTAAEIDNLGPLADTILASITRPAFMSVSVNLVPPAPSGQPAAPSAAGAPGGHSAQYGRTSGLGTDAAEATIGMHELDRARSQAIEEVDRAMDEMLMPEVQEAPAARREHANASPLGMSAFSAALMAAAGSGGMQLRSFGMMGPAVEIELHLWRADMATSVIDVDGDGKVVVNSELPPLMQQLYPPGLLVGASAERMGGRPVSRFLPPLKERSVNDLYADVSSQAKAEEDAQAQKRSNLKHTSAKQKAAESMRRAAPPMTIKVHHSGDGLDLSLNLQVVSKEGLGRGCYILLRVATPRVGRRDLREYLEMRAQRSADKAAAGLGTGRRALHRHNTNLSFASTTRVTTEPAAGPASNTALPAIVATAIAATAYSSVGSKSMRSMVDKNGGRLSPGSAKVDVQVANAAQAAVSRTPPKLSRDSDSGGATAAPPRPPDVPLLPPSLVAMEIPRAVSHANPAQEQPATDLAELPSARVRFSGNGPQEGGDAAPVLDDGIKETAKEAKEPEDPVKHWVWSNGSEFHNRSPMRSPRTPRAVVSTSAAPAVATTRSSPMEPVFVFENRPAGTGAEKLEMPARKGGIDAGQESDSSDEDQRAKEQAASAKVTIAFAQVAPPPPKPQAAPPPSNHDASSEEDGAHAQSASGSERESGSAGESSAGGDHQEGDYRRGKRFKKLFRLLESDAAQKHVTRYRLHTTALVFMLAAVEIGMFVLISHLLVNQIDILSDLRNIGLAASAASDLAITSRNFNMIYWNLTYDTLRFVNDPVNDLAPLKALYRTQIDTFQVLHKGAYLGYTKKRSLPTANGVRNMWDSPSLPETIFYTIAFNESLNNFTTQSINKQTRQASLWDLGNNLVIKANNIWLNSDWWLEYYKMDFFLNPDMNYILINYADAVIVGYLATLDGLVTYVVDNANQVNKIQIILLIFQGLVLCSITVLYVWTLSSRVAGFRYNFYNVFLLVPQGLARALATMRLNLADEGHSDDEDEDAVAAKAPADTGAADDDGAAEAPTALSAPKAKRSSHKGTERGSDNPGGMRGNRMGSMIHLGSSHHAAEDQSFRQGGVLGTAKRLGSSLMFWRRRAPVAALVKAKGKKRQLHTSASASWWLVWPFMLWGAVVVIVNGVGYSMLAKISGPVSTYIILNFVTVMFQRTIFTLQELVFEPALDRMTYWRELTYSQISALRREYHVLMLGGAKAAPEETSPHYTLVKQGITTSSGSISQLLFSTNDCLCLKKDQCWPPGSKYHEYTHHGINHMMQRFIELGDTINDYGGLDPYMSGELYGYYWATFPDLGGGFSELNRLYHLEVQAVYMQVRSMHIAGLVLTLLILVGYVLLIMRPFIAEIANETRRVAELLSQLPNEVDVEGVLARLVVNGSTNQRLPSSKGGDALNARSLRSGSGLKAGSHKFKD